MNKTLGILLLFLICVNFFSINIFAQNKNVKKAKKEYVKAFPRNGDGLQTFFQRYGLQFNSKNKKFLLEKNSGKFFKKEGLIQTNEYLLPIEILNYKETIASTIRNNDIDLVNAVEEYNIQIVKSGIKKSLYTEDDILWYPINISFKKIAKKQEEKFVTKLYPIFGAKYQEVKQISNKLYGNVFYLISGHGGPDPGAIGSRNGYELHEDEYAYDVTLRFARKIIENGGLVYIIVQDEDDGIRDMQYLNNDYHELLVDGSTISANQKTRLQQRTEIINRYYNKHKDEYKQYVIEIHVDSRTNQKGIDIFFYHNPGSNVGERLATTMLKTLSQKYEKAQPGRGYHGTVSSRNLHTLRESAPVGVYIELGNIQNPRDQIRLIEPNNRQAIANWLCDGLYKGLR